MKRTVIVTAAALMFAGTTALSLAYDEATTGGQNSSTAATLESTKPAVKSTVEKHVKPDASMKTENKSTTTQSHQPSVNMNSKSDKATPTSMSEKKSEPMAENKPAATLSDTIKSTANTAGDSAKTAVTEPAKSAAPTPNAPTPPTPSAAKTVVSPTAPAAPSPATPPTK